MSDEIKNKDGEKAEETAKTDGTAPVEEKNAEPEVKKDEAVAEKPPVKKEVSVSAEPTEPEEPPYDFENDRVVLAVRKKFGDEVVEVTCNPILPDNITLEIKAGSIHQVCLFMRDDKELSYTLLSDQSGNHFEEGHFEVLYHLYSFDHNHRIRLRVKLEDEKQSINSVVDVWPTANWFEREIYDMYGIEFNNHPDMRRILMPEYWKGHPQRKDYPLQYVPERFRENWWKEDEQGKPVLTYEFLEDNRG
ncbi:MAG: NADH-quinone oxidoreductase subunit C [Nitrospinae bacterium]|nr:NADH-quinone oxidoreductase subunit C [Nitrospinota bacterium]